MTNNVKLASQTPSGISEEIDEDEAEGEVETTLYFDAEEGVLRDEDGDTCLLYTSPSPRDGLLSRMPSSA